MHGNDRGFTLIELLVVIAIIGVLSSIALVSLNGAREKAKRVKAQSEIKQMYGMLQAYNIEYDAWPPNCDNMDTLGEWNGAWNTYGKAVTMDPWGEAYHFDGCPDIECEPGYSSLCSSGPDMTFQSQNRTDMTVQGDDICIYFEPEC